MKIATIIGARPQFIKAAAVSRAIAGYNASVGSGPEVIKEIIVHTGQHYDHNMSDVFFEEMKIPKPDHFLNVNGLNHGAMTGQMLEKIEAVLISENPDMVMIYGDTNTTLAGALAASKLHISVSHIEAGLRSFNRRMPEEINRLVSDHLSNYLFCPTANAVDNLELEGITHLDRTGDTHPAANQPEANVYLVGDVMYDCFLFYQKQVEENSELFLKFGLEAKKYCLATVHRAENTDIAVNLSNIFDAFESICREGYRIVVPIHPRTRKILKEIKSDLEFGKQIILIPPVSYFEMMALEINSKVILTDSGGVQKEAYFARVPCVTLRNETEWIETVEDGWNCLAGSDTNKIISEFQRTINAQPEKQSEHYGRGNASERIVKLLADSLA